MKKHQIFHITFLFLAFIISCNKVTEEKGRSYIMAFYDYNDFLLELTPAGNIVLLWNPSNIIRSAMFKSNTRESVALYDLLCQKYNDMNYNKKIRYIKYPTFRYYHTNEIVAIDVVSDNDFNEYSAGASLSNVVHLLSASPKQFIQSNYQNIFDWNINQPQKFTKEPLFRSYFSFYGFQDGRRVDSQHHPVAGFLSELEQSDLQLLGLGNESIGFLVFDKLPERMHEIHKFTVTIHLEDGRVLSQTIAKSFFDSVVP